MKQTMDSFQITQRSLIWIIVTLFVAYSFCLTTAAAVFSDAIKSTLNVNIYQISIISGAFILGFACLQIPIGYLLDKYNSRFIVSFGIFLLLIGNTVSIIPGGFKLLMFGNFVQGMGASFAFLSAAVLISQWFSKKYFPILLGLTQTVSCISAGMLHYFFTILLNSHGFREIYQFLAIFGIILFILAICFVRSPGKVMHKKNLPLRISLGLSFKNKEVILCSIAAAVSLGTFFSYASYWYLDVQNFYSTAKLDSIAISGAIFFGMAIGTPAIGWFSNIIKSRITALHLSLVLGTMALLLGLFLPHFNINTLAIIKTISFLIGFFLSGSMLFYTMVSENSPDSYRGIALSILNTCVFLFNTLMFFIPLLFAVNSSTLFFNYLWTLPFFILIAILLLHFIKETYPVTS